MRVETRLFGEIDIAEEKIITLGRGLIGYPDMKRFTLIFDEEKQARSCGCNHWMSHSLLCRS